MAGRRKKSKKRSAASSISTQPDPIFFLDHCLGGPQIAGALRSAGARVDIHTDHFPQDMTDRELLAAVGQRDWVFVSKDSNIRRRPLEANALMAAKVRAFYLTAGNLRGDEQAALFVQVLARMRRLCRRPGPFIARITAGGDVAIVREGK